MSRMVMVGAYVYVAFIEPRYLQDRARCFDWGCNAINFSLEDLTLDWCKNATWFNSDCFGLTAFVRGGFFHS